MPSSKNESKVNQTNTLYHAPVIDLETLELGAPDLLRERVLKREGVSPYVAQSPQESTSHSVAQSLSQAPRLRD